MNFSYVHSALKKNIGKLGVIVSIDSKKSYSFPAKQQKIITGLANQIAWHLNQERNITKYPDLYMLFSSIPYPIAQIRYLTPLIK